jgi:hypothetical protein
MAASKPEPGMHRAKVIRFLRAARYRDRFISFRALVTPLPGDRIGEHLRTVDQTEDAVGRSVLQALADISSSSHSGHVIRLRKRSAASSRNARARTSSQMNSSTGAATRTT